MIDEKIGEILQTLEETGYLDHSIVIFTSDHGDCLTDHGHSQKWTMYDTITRMPTIVWAPGRCPGGRRVKAMCQQFDLAPTILELANASIDYPMAAKSLLPLLENGDDPERGFRDVVFAEQARDGNLTDTDFMTMVRTRHWKLVHFLEEEWGQLFDLQKDPDEVNNLWNDSSCQGPKHELLGLLREWRIRDAYDNSSLWQKYR